MSIVQKLIVTSVTYRYRHVWNSTQRNHFNWLKFQGSETPIVTLLFVFNHCETVPSMKRACLQYIALSKQTQKAIIFSDLSEPWTLNQFKRLRARGSYENDVPANRILHLQNYCSWQLLHLEHIFNVESLIFRNGVKVQLTWNVWLLHVLSFVKL